MGRFENGELASAQGAGFGLAAAGLHGTSCVIKQGRITLALYGHPTHSGTTEGPIAAAGSRLLDEYLARGAQAVASLRGDFSLALIDEASGLLLLAIDRIGIRNLVYASRGSGVIFGPTCDVVAAHPVVERTIDPQGIYNYAYFHIVPGPRTIFHELRRIPAAHCLIARGGKLNVAPYWTMQFDEDAPCDVERFKPGFLASLREGVRAFAMRDRCGTFLSGGTDSSTIAGLVGEISGRPARTYSIGFAADGYDETNYAQIAARHFATAQHEYYVTPADVVEAIPKIVDVYDQPFGNASAVPTYYCARLAQRDGIALMLGGDGGDELFGGNARYAKQYQLALYDRVPTAVRRRLVEPVLLGSQLSSRFSLLEKARSYIEQASLPMPARYDSYNLLERLGPANVFTADFLAQCNRAEPLALLSSSYSEVHAKNWLNRILGLDLKFTLADNDLPKVTRMCELAGVDVAFPMLHESVVEFAASLPPGLKLRRTQLRYFFKEALRGFLPDAIIAKQKHGFGLPVGTWLQSYGPLRERAVTSLESLKARQIVRPAFIDELISLRLHEHAGYYGTMIWLLMMLELWLRKQSVH